MTDPTDDVMKRLAAADPVEPRTLPSPSSSRAQETLETIMSSEIPAPEPMTDSTHEPVRMLDLPQVPGVSRRRGRGRGWFLGAAAAVIALLAGFLVLAPDNTSPALATVQGAAQATAEADTGRISTEFFLEGTDGLESEQVAGRLDATFAGSDVALTVEIDEAVGSSGLGELPVTTARLVDGVFYAAEGDQWYAVETGGFIGRTLVDIVDPRSVLVTVQDLLDTQEIGSATIDGVSTTQYRSVVDLGDETLAESGWLALEGVEIDADGEVVVDLYVDDDGLLRRLDVAGEVREPDNGSGSASFTVSTSFTDIGADLTVEAPEGAIEIDPLDGAGVSELFGGGD